LSDTQRTMGALNSPIRREILWRVWDQELPVGVIVQSFELTPPTISGHLAVLRDAGLVSVRAGIEPIKKRYDGPATWCLGIRCGGCRTAITPSEDSPKRQRRWPSW
jgi:DNA-binding transcriptional ArsR family regulator